MRTQLLALCADQCCSGGVSTFIQGKQGLLQADWVWFARWYRVHVRVSESEARGTYTRTSHQQTPRACRHHAKTKKVSQTEMVYVG